MHLPFDYFLRIQSPPILQFEQWHWSQPCFLSQSTSQTSWRHSQKHRTIVCILHKTQHHNSKVFWHLLPRINHLQTITTAFQIATMYANKCKGTILDTSVYWWVGFTYIHFHIYNAYSSAYTVAFLRWRNDDYRINIGTLLPIPLSKIKAF